MGCCHTCLATVWFGRLCTACLCVCAPEIGLCSIVYVCTCLCVQLIELDVEGPLELSYDPEWLAVLRSTHHLYSASRHGPRLPDNWGGRRGAQAWTVHSSRLIKCLC